MRPSEDAPTLRGLPGCGGAVSKQPLEHAQCHGSHRDRAGQGPRQSGRFILPGQEAEGF